jgi:Domain of unknown function (DUF4345)
MDNRMEEGTAMERILLQMAVAVAGLAGVGLGLTGVLFGTLYADLSGDVVLDSYVRFLKGALLAIGLIYWSCIPQIERRGDQISLVTFILVLGTLSRLLSVVGHGVPTLGIVANLIAGLILVPLLWLWQRHLASAALRNALT